MFVNKRKNESCIFKGAATAIITPFKNGAVDYDALTYMIERQIDAGISALVVCGTTGEAPTLSADEKNSVITHAAEAVRHRIPVIAGVTSNDTRKNIQMAKDAVRCGADGIMTAAPYYNKPTQDGIVSHISSVADAVNIPVIAYNVPSRTGVSMTPDTVRRLADHGNILGVKEASGDLTLASELLSDANFPIAVYSGCDELTLPMLSLGGDGVISVVSNVFPYETEKMCRSFFDGDTKTALYFHSALFPVIKALFSVSNPIPVKAACRILELCENELRRPLLPLSDEKNAILSEVIYKARHKLSLFH